MEEPKYLKLKKELIKYIRSQRDEKGNKMPSEKELSENYSVSRYTVRRALNILQKEGYIYSVKGSGTYIKNKNPILQKHTIGVITTYENYIFSDIIKSIDNELSKRNIEMILGVTYNRAKREGEIIENMLSKDIEGFIIEPSKSAFPNPNIKLFNRLNALNKPYILINGYYRDLKSPTMLLDDIDGGYKLTSYLIENGHNKIACILKADDIQGHRRYEGYLKALKEYDVELDEDLIDWYTTENIDEIIKSSGLIDKLKKGTAVICYNDQLALRINKLLSSNGLKVPSDISMVSFDNSKFAHLAGLKLTSIDYPGNDLGTKVARKISKAIVDKGKIHKEILPANLVINGSVKKIEGKGKSKCRNM